MHALWHINILRGSVQLFHTVAGDPMTLFNLAEGGRLSGASLASMGTTGTEGASGGSVEGGGNITGQGNAVILTGDLGVGHGNSRHQRLGIGMQGALVDLGGVGQLDHLA